MKKIIYISTAFPKENEGATIYTDLAEKLVSSGHQVTVVATEEKGKGAKTEMVNEYGCRVLRVVCGRHYNVGVLEKGITYLRLEYQLKKAIKHYLGKEKFDLILFAAPPVTLTSVVAFLKHKFNAKAFLMMKDIFPQNAVDLKIMKKNGLIYHYFRNKEKRMYKVADCIGCMSEMNIQYITKHNPYVKEKCIYFPNTKKISWQLEEVDKNKIRKIYGLPAEAVVFIFGGNMGIPQGMEFLCKGIKRLSYEKNVFFVLVGRGTEKKVIRDCLGEQKNVLILEDLKREQYEGLVRACDVGIVSLNHNFTIPNYPSRILSYMEYSLPVLAATDTNTDFKKLIMEDARCGVWCESDNVDDFIASVRKLMVSPEKREKMGGNGRKYMEDNFDVKKSVELIENVMN